MLSSQRVSQLMCDLYAEARFQFELSHQEAVDRSVRVMTATLRTLNGGNDSLTLSLDANPEQVVGSKWVAKSRVKVDAKAMAVVGRRCHCGSPPTVEYDQPDCVPICEECLKDYTVGTSQEHAMLKAMWQN